MRQLIIIALMVVGFTTYAQNKNAKALLKVDGVCMMCKSRIEKACYSVKGVKSASWDVNTHKLKLHYDENKTDLKTITKSITAAGHDTEVLKATDEAYDKVHPCCKYRDAGVVDEH